MMDEAGKTRERIYLVDGSGYIFRAFYALPPLTRPSDGLPVGAVAGFCAMLWKLILETEKEFQNNYLAIIFDKSSKSFRNAIYPEYKAHRPDTPEDLIPQFPLFRAACRAFGLPAIELEEYEADDLIASYANHAQRRGTDCVIISADKDLMQMIGPGISMKSPLKDQQIGVAEVVEKFGVRPEKMVDMQALAGDKTDNVPGVPGVGVKTAARLINEYGTLETLLQNAHNVPQNKLRENLINHAELARISKKLVTLERNCPLPVALDDCKMSPVDPVQLLGFLKAMEFNTLTRRIGEALAVGEEEILPDPDFAPDKSNRQNQVAQAKVDDLAFNLQDYTTITQMSQLQEWIAEIERTGIVAIDTETDNLDPQIANLVGISLAIAPAKACYIPLGHIPHNIADNGSGSADLYAKQENSQSDIVLQLPVGEVIKALGGVLEAPDILKIGQNIKYDMRILSHFGLKIAPIDDTMLISYALAGGRHSHGLDELAKRFLEHQPISFTSVTGAGKNRKKFSQIAIDVATSYAGEDADVTFRLWWKLKQNLAKAGRLGVYETLERGMPAILAEMEGHGVKIDAALLTKLSKKLARQMADLAQEIYALAGEEFTIASPKQLARILYQKLSLTANRKTSGGQASTDARALEDLVLHTNHLLPSKILEWRQLAKLKSTYTDALPEHIDKKTGRVHTSYSLAATTTGRLASTAPNLQNIPIRTPLGRQIRTAFIADCGNCLLSADYNQIELRLLAHIADIGALQEAFRAGLDIHRSTAAEIFNLPIAAIDPTTRRNAKAINFGIIYGMSAFGLAQALKIPRAEAGEYIARYFARFPGIQKYMAETKKFAKEHGYVETIFGRRCHVTMVGGRGGDHGAADRAAINAPIQGSAADIIRRAMLRIPQKLRAGGFATKMLMQVHDELVFEAPQEEVEEVSMVIREVMEKASLPVVELATPILVDVHQGRNWDEAH